MHPHRDEPYRAFVRSKPCCSCGSSRGVEAHHAFGPYLGGGKSLKGSDYGSVPLCLLCHRGEHDGRPVAPERMLLSMAQTLVAWRWSKDATAPGMKALRIVAGDIARRMVTALFGEGGEA